MAEVKNYSGVLALRLRHSRLVAGLTLKQLSEAAQCSESLISKIERNAAMPSLATLHRLASVLNTNISDLMSEEVPVGETVMRKDERPCIASGDITLERLVLPRRNGLLQANIHIVAEGGRSDGQIVHQGEEVGYVLQGTMELTLDDQVHVLQPGDAFNFSSQTPHGYRNVGEGELKILWVNTPATF